MCDIINILAIDNHPIFLEGLDSIFSSTNDIKIIDAVQTEEEAYEVLETTKQIDVVIIDVTVFNGNDFGFLSDIKNKYSNIPIIILTFHSAKEYAIDAFRHGANAFISKIIEPEILIKATRQVAQGKKYINSSVAKMLANYFEHGENNLLHKRLTKREFQVMKLLASGKNINEIARKLSIKPKTVRSYKAKIMKKMNIKNDAQLAIYAIKHKLI